MSDPGQQALACETTRVIIVDDHDLVRAGVRALIEKIDGVQVVAETGNGHEVIALAQQYQPAILLLDISLPGVNAFDIMGQLERTLPDVRVIVISTHDSDEYAAHAIRAGAAAYLPKSAAGSELVLAISAVKRGEKYLSPTLAHGAWLRQLPAAMTSDSRVELTPRQRQVLKLIADGHRTRDIAAELGISVKTVETHRTQLMERLNIHDVPGLVRYAIRMGLVEVDS